ncbi:MAG: histidine kinase [Eubacteriales bacterium]|nr:histidine kinase [Eubacteriales bacterium]
MYPHIFSKEKRPSLRSFITVTVALIVTVVLLCSTFFYYNRTSSLLRGSSQESIIRQLNQVNETITVQIDSIDSLIPLFMSNNLISDVLENPQPENTSTNNRFQIERQMSYIYCSSPLSSKNFTNSIYIICDDDTVFHTYTSGNLEATAEKSLEIQEYADKEDSRLMCFTLPSDKNNIYFGRNLYNSNTGQHMGMMMLNIDLDKWIRYCARGLDPAWFISLYSSHINMLSNPDMKSQSEEIQEHIAPQSNNVSFQEMKLKDASYYVAAQRLEEIGLTSAVAAPKELLLRDLNATLKSYLLLLAATIIIALFAAIIISQAVTRPINRMVFHINEISRGKQSTLPAMKMYREFDVWADAFNQMLKQLDIYYNDNFQKQLLLKNAEIQALQSQMDPHFMFNVLNTIAWKAQMIDNEEIYQMVISLGELLKMNTISKEQAFVPLEKEMEYVRFYIYLQQMRFEDKISCTIQIPNHLLHCPIPCFCIQPLVENSIVHGLEPKKGRGKLAIQVIEKDNSRMEICIADNGVGFSEIPDVRNIPSSAEDSHTHIGLRNLDKRLELIFGEEARLRISSTPNVCTSISFTIPINKEETL